MRFTDLAPASALAATLVLSAPVAAQDLSAPLSADAFEEMVEGRYFTHFQDGVPYAIEAYFPGRRTIWLIFGDPCIEGEWYERDGYICFVYEDSEDVEHCWHYLARDDGALVARPRGNPFSEIELFDDGEPLTCPGYGV